jgi:ABC-type multidrug transport system fused ATPase/permease subunit
MKGWTPDEADLELLGTTRADFTHRLVVLIGSEIAVLVVLFSVLLLSGWFVAPEFFLIVGLAAPVTTWIMHVRDIAVKAEVRRADMDLAVAVFLDLVNVLLAGGAGVETAILAAAEAGDGWGFSQIRLSLARSQSARQSYWDGLRELGRTVGVESLEEVANSVQLAGEHGARVRQSLATKALALRHRNLARIEHDAQRRTEQMGLPVVLLFMGFIVLVGYPAFVGTIGAL